MTPLPLRLQNVRIVPGDGPVIERGTVLTTADGRLDFVGPADLAPVASAEETRIDGSGRTVLPGFVDCHVHFAMQPGRGALHHMRTDPAMLALETADRMRRTLHAGVTAARDLMGTTRGFREAQANGLIEGPRLTLAVAAISHTGGHADSHLPGGTYTSHLPPTALLADTEDEVRLAVRRILRDGADVIKICTTGGMSSPHDGPDDEGLTLAEVRAVVEESDRRGGRPVAAHAQGRAGILTALRGGVTSIEHGYGIDQEGIDLLGEHGGVLVPTLSTALEPMDPTRTEPHHREKKERWRDRTFENISRAIEQGTRIALGTDAGVVEHARNLRELGHLVSLGMSPLAAIRAGTAVAADLLGDPSVGRLLPGLRADLVLADGAPDRDITALAAGEAVRLVVQDGRIVRDDRSPEEVRSCAGRTVAAHA